jgi:Uncharacterized alpha/beta hydrolase domain (DUF2235)
MGFSSSTESCPYAGGSSATMRTTPSPRPATPARTRPTQRARVTMFFDGTLNNRNNTMRRLLGSIPRGAHEAGAADSFSNDYSNIARLEPGMALCGAPYDRHFRTYVEGIGTSNNSSDSTAGTALGTGDTGVPAKVRRGLNWAIAQLRSMPTSKDFEYIHIDAFGFSRGAAAARYFINQALNDGDTNIRGRLTESGFTVGTISVRFVGLFDTVASYGVAHYNDTSDLSLDAISVAEQVIHIAAAEEHRDNFRLTNTNSANGADSLQLFLPGVHSDIGGGYNAGYAENLILWEESASGLAFWRDDNARRNTERAWFISQGWFTAAQLTDETIDLGDAGTLYRLRGRRTVPNNQYPLIPMKMMADYASEKNLVFSNLASPGGGFLGGVETQLRSYAATKRAAHRAHGTESRPGNWFHRESAMLRILRAEHFHFSAHYATAAGGLIHPNAPNYNGDTRHRTIQDG